MTLGKTIRMRRREQIASLIRSEVLTDFRPGQRLDSEQALARRFGVSVLTIREALSTLVGAGLIDRRHGSGTYVSSPVATNHVAVYSEMDIFIPGTSSFLHAVIQRSRQYFERRGFRTRFYVGRNPPGEKQIEPTCAEFLEDDRDHKIRGVFALATVPHPRWMDMLLRNHIPIVGDENYHCSLLYDHEGMMKEAVGYLVAHGRRKIALMGWKGDYLTERLPGGFRAAVRHHGVWTNERWLMLDWHPNRPGAGWEEFREIWMTPHEKPDGLVVADDILFREAMMAIIELGVKVPEQLMVVTFAGKGSGIRAPFRVAQLEIDPEAYVQCAGDMLVQLMEKRPLKENKVYLPWRFLVPEQAESGRRAESAQGMIGARAKE